MQFRKRLEHNYYTFPRSAYDRFTLHLSTLSFCFVMKQKQKLNNFHFLRKREWQLGFLSFFFGHLLFRIGQSFLNNITLSMYFLMSF